MTDDLPERLRAEAAPLKTYAEVCADAVKWGGPTIWPKHPVDERAALRLSNLLTEAASLIQRLEGERDEWKADAKHYISRCGEQQEALETAEQALSASQKEVERLSKLLGSASDAG